MPFFGTPEEKATRRLFRAIQKGDEKTFLEALEAGASISAKGHYPALYQCASNGFLFGVKTLIERKVDLDEPGWAGRTPLAEAVQDGRADIASVLLESGAKPDIVDKYGVSPLHRAAQRGSRTFVDMLLAHGADVTQRGPAMSSVADVAQKDYPRIAEYLQALIDQKEKPLGAPNVWHLTGDQEVARINDKKLIGYRVTEMFNFAAGTYTQIFRNLSNGAETQSMLPLTQLQDSALLAQAAEEVKRKSGHAPVTAAIDKPRMPTLQGGT